MPLPLRSTAGAAAADPGPDAASDRLLAPPARAALAAAAAARSAAAVGDALAWIQGLHVPPVINASAATSGTRSYDAGMAAASGSIHGGYVADAGQGDA